MNPLYILKSSMKSAFPPVMAHSTVD